MRIGARWLSLARFAIVGSIGFVVDAGIVWILCREGVSPIVARLPSLSTAILVTWLLNRKFTFRVRSARSIGELCRYSGVAIGSALLNYLCYDVFIVLGVVPVAAVAMASVLLLFLSYYGYGRFAFRAGM